MISVCHGNDVKSREELEEWALGKGHCRRGHWEKGNRGGTLENETSVKSHWEKGEDRGIAGA